MKRILNGAVLFLLMLVGCSKPNANELKNFSLSSAVADSGYLSVVQKYIRVHPSIGAYDSIDFTNYHVSKFEKYWYLRLPFEGKSIAGDFILLQTDSLGVVSTGRIIHLERIKPEDSIREKNYNGVIVIRSLEQQVLYNSKITNGFIEAFHPYLFASTRKLLNNNKAESFPVPKIDDLPEVVVVAYLPAASTASGISACDYMLLQSLFNGSGGGGGSGSGGNGGSSGSGGTSNGSNGGGSDYGYGIYSPLDYGDPSTPYPISGEVPPHQDPNLNLQYDESFFRPAIDLNAWLKCFNDIPDEGSHSSIMILGDLPDESNPSLGMNLWTGNTGHCFLQLSKSNGAQSVTQIIGFTAQNAFKAIVNTDAYVPSKIVDNAGHKFNCVLNMPLTPAGMREVMKTIVNQADMPYSVDRYDCLDFALDVINSVRPDNKLVIDKTRIINDPFSNVANGPKLYALLQNMIDNQSPETPNIALGGSLHAGVSHGPCY